MGGPSAEERERAQAVGRGLTEIVVLRKALEAAERERDEARAEAGRYREWAPILEAAKRQDGKWRRPMPTLPSEAGVYVWALKASEEMGELSAALLGRFIGKDGRGDPLAECHELIAVLLRIAAALKELRDE